MRVWRVAAAEVVAVLAIAGNVAAQNVKTSSALDVVARLYRDFAWEAVVETPNWQGHELLDQLHADLGFPRSVGEFRVDRLDGRSYIGEGRAAAPVQNPAEGLELSFGEDARRLANSRHRSAGELVARQSSLGKTLTQLRLGVLDSPC